MSDDISFSPKELFDRIESRFSEMNHLISQQGQAQSAEIREVRHRVANIKTIQGLHGLKFDQISDEISDIGQTMNKRLDDHETRIRKGEQRDNEGVGWKSVGAWVGIPLVAALVSAFVAGALPS